MSRFALLLSILLLFSLIMLGGLQPSPTRVTEHVHSPLVLRNHELPGAVCFAPGTPDEYMAEWQRRIWGDKSLDFRIGTRWEQTAHGNTGSEGDPITLTYSFVPDGVRIDGQPSRLFARMNELFGSPAVWQALFASVFQRWSEVSGISYIQVSDDGAAFPNSEGILGRRGDVRIGCIPIDGESGVLAYNWYPDRGDMVLDASEDWGRSVQNYIFLRNVVSHEHGHGWGLSHVCPANATKLLEPYYTSAFDGPQHDDIRGAQRNYGDRFEPNDAASAATPLGILANDFMLREVGLDHRTDVDFWSFTIPAGRGFSLTLEPWGYAYLEGPQLESGCSPGSWINTVDDLDLNLYLYDASGTTLLAQSASHPAGEAEQIYRYPVPAQGGGFQAKVTAGSGTDAVQLYRLVFDVYYRDDPYLTRSPIAFDTVRQSAPAQRTTTLVNGSATTMQLYEIRATAPFSVTPSWPQSLRAGDSLVLTIGFSPDTLGPARGTLTVLHSGPGHALTCSLSAFAASSWIEFLTPNRLNFGRVQVGRVDSGRVGIRAFGNIPVTVTALTTRPPFSIRPIAPFSMGPTQALFLWPRFAPTQVGFFEDILVITHDGTSSPDTIFLQGEGIPLWSEEHVTEMPQVFALKQNYPNPFNAVTMIPFELPEAAVVQVDIFDVNGRLAKRIPAQLLQAGRHSIEFSAEGLSSGVYFYRLIAGPHVATAKMVLIR